MTLLSIALDELRPLLDPRKKTKQIGNVLSIFAILSLSPLAFAATADQPNGRALVERSLAAGERNEELLRAYVSRSRSDSKQLGTDERVKSEEIKIYDDVEKDEYHVKTLVEKDDRSLTASELQKEETRVAKLVSQRKRESPEGRSKRIAEAKEKRDKDHRFARELLEAFDFQVVGAETVAGRKAWIVDATPHPGYKPRELKAQIFPHLRGRLWIDQQELLWVKAEADGIDPFSVGFSIIAKLDQGAHLFFEQSRLPDGVWVLHKLGIKAKGRIAMMKRFSIENATTFENYRKVPPALRISDGKDDDF